MQQVGFSAADVESVCDVGASSKADASRADGSTRIGCKGIGFKSVFMVSDEPTICSRAATESINPPLELRAPCCAARSYAVLGACWLPGAR